MSYHLRVQWWVLAAVTQQSAWKSVGRSECKAQTMHTMIGRARLLPVFAVNTFKHSLVLAKRVLQLWRCRTS
jgi:hypothetical protein